MVLLALVWGGLSNSLVASSRVSNVVMLKKELITPSCIPLHPPSPQASEAEPSPCTGAALNIPCPELQNCNITGPIWPIKVMAKFIFRVRQVQLH